MYDLISFIYQFISIMYPIPLSIFLSGVVLALIVKPIPINYAYKRSLFMILYFVIPSLCWLLLFLAVTPFNFNSSSPSPTGFWGTVGTAIFITVFFFAIYPFLLCLLPLILWAYWGLGEFVYSTIIKVPLTRKLLYSNRRIIALAPIIIFFGMIYTYHSYYDLGPKDENMTKLLEWSDPITGFGPHWSIDYDATLHHKIIELQSKKHLRVGCNSLTELPPEIGYLVNLERLDLFHHNSWVGPPLNGLPPEIGNLTNLKTLDLTRSQVSELPPEIGNLTNLKTLDLSYTSVSELPPEIGNLINLQELRLYGTQISELPPEIEALPNLTIYRD